jgi:hypothetical protein
MRRLRIAEGAKLLWYLPRFRQGSQGSRKGAVGAVFSGVRSVAQSIAYDAYLSNDQSYQFN